ncbi:Uncharacterized protein DAT39_005490, partial [Clarias magur]
QGRERGRGEREGEAQRMGRQGAGSRAAAREERSRGRSAHRCSDTPLQCCAAVSWNSALITQ